MKDNSNRKKIPAKLLKLLQKEVKSKCPICANEDVGHLEVHHIDGKKENNIEQNLIMLCPTCHSKVTKGDISEAEITELKINLLIGKANNDKPTNPKQMININAPVHKSVVANTIHTQAINIKGKTKPNINHPEGSIGADNLKHNYIQHLIDRYNKFTKDDEYKPKFSYAVIFNNIKKQFGASCYNIPVSRFDDLCIFLQNKIKNTRLGRILNSRGRKLFSTFEEYIEKYC